MGFKLVNEVKAWLPRAPHTIKAPERLALWAIAERANDGTREAWPSPTWDLAALLGIQPNGLSRVLQRLGDAGYEVRVQRGTDARGRPVYAYRGAQTTYRLPVLITGTPPPPTDQNAWPAGQPFNVGKVGPQARHSRGERLAHRPGMPGPQARKAGPQARNAWPTGQPFSPSRDVSPKHHGLDPVVPCTATRHSTTGQAADYTDAERRYIHYGGQLFVDAHPKLTPEEGEALTRAWLESERRWIAKGNLAPEGHLDLNFLRETINEMDADDIEAELADALEGNS
ncbi:MarR family winged helix-turn-helix transcriptional regulator [Micromonospora sp. NPDC049891]|uniref:MarR family winged helix-turn-helix transcriptional regulator n=1 Tax=Micromonospora sp. NPDC049891 TaxID=3155655 RepID=UPI0033F9C4CA